MCPYKGKPSLPTWYVGSTELRAAPATLFTQPRVDLLTDITESCQQLWGGFVIVFKFSTTEDVASFGLSHHPLRLVYSCI